MITIEVDLSRFQALVRRIENLDRSMREIMSRQLMLVQSTWQAAVLGAQLPGMTRAVRDEKYAQSIASADSLQYPFNGDPFWGRVIALDQRIAKRYEEGYPRFDIKPGLFAGPKAKVGKHGQRYSTVPFSHGTPGSGGQAGPPMPESVYAMVRALPYGGRLNLPEGMSRLGAATSSSGYRWRLSPFQGMVKLGSSGQTQYRTFRRVSEVWFDAKGHQHGSDPGSWIHPGLRGNPIVEAVVRAVTPQIQQSVQAMILEAIRG